MMGKRRGRVSATKERGRQGESPGVRVAVGESDTWRGWGTGSGAVCRQVYARDNDQYAHRTSG